MYSGLVRDLLFILLQYLKENKFLETAHEFERGSQLYFDIAYMQELIEQGKFKKAEHYLSGFTKIEDNWVSMTIFFEIRKQNYLEAIDNNDKTKALEILTNDLKAFETIDNDTYRKLEHLLALNNMREDSMLAKLPEAHTMRSGLSNDLRKYIYLNPLLQDKLNFPDIPEERLRGLINQSLNWQHSRCQNPIEDPHIVTLFHDHVCGDPRLPSHFFQRLPFDAGTLSLFPTSDAAIAGPSNQVFGPTGDVDGSGGMHNI